MLRSGELTVRMHWFAAPEGIPPVWSLRGKLWAKLIEPKSAGREGQSSIYVSSASLICVRPRPGLAAGHLLRTEDAWWLIDDVARLPGEYQLTARKLSGMAATYQPVQGENYAVSAWLSQENLLVGARNEVLQQIDLIKPELLYPFARIGDWIILNGRTYKIQGVVEGSDNGTTLRVSVN